MANNNLQALAVGTTLKGSVYTYTIEKVLGQGAFGITYLASTKMKGLLGKVTVQVALKEFFAKELDARLENGAVSARTEDGIALKYAQAFLWESENLSKMKHPGIVNVLEAFEANGTYYYSMEYLSGSNLDEKVKAVGIPEKDALPLIRQIGEALSYMHDRKVMNLDLKPQNIMLKDDGTPVIIDFGLSKQYDDSGEPESSSSIGLGTPGYAPTEQATQTSSREFQPSQDIYALGATLYKMLTGNTPPAATIILNKKFPTAALEEKGITQSTIEAIKTAMSPIVDNRPQSVAAFLALLDGARAASPASPGKGATQEAMVKPHPVAVPPKPDGNPTALKSNPKNWPWILLVGIIVAVIAVSIIIGGNKESRIPSTGYSNGHEWVDMGLSVNWATMNVGALSPSDWGIWVAWGETNPEVKSTYYNYKFLEPGDSTFHKFSKYNYVDGLMCLELSDDAARVNWGGAWRMPTKKELDELIEECTWVFTKRDGKYGYLTISNINTNSIFLPCHGVNPNPNINDTGVYWSSSLSHRKWEAYRFHIYHSGISSEDEEDRYYTCMIRAVIDNKNRIKVTPQVTIDKTRLFSSVSGSSNGHEWVDLGLPSGVKWATRNIGASSLNDNGDMFSWGETKPKSKYEESTYSWTTDDAAQFNWGASWRLPTISEFEELLINCRFTWTTIEDKNGFLITSKNNNNCIFLPSEDGSYWSYWSSSIDSNSYYARHLWFNSYSNALDASECARCYGLLVRPVID